MFIHAFQRYQSLTKNRQRNTSSLTSRLRPRAADSLQFLPRVHGPSAPTLLMYTTAAMRPFTVCVCWPNRHSLVCPQRSQFEIAGVEFQFVPQVPASFPLVLLSSFCFLYPTQRKTTRKRGTHTHSLSTLSSFFAKFSGGRHVVPYPVTTCGLVQVRRYMGRRAKEHRSLWLDDCHWCVHPFSLSVYPQKNAYSTGCIECVVCLPAASPG